MVIGVGTDLMEIERIERSIARFGGVFLQRVFTPGEVAYCQAKKNSGESFAARLKLCPFTKPVNFSGWQCSSAGAKAQVYFGALGRG